MDFVCLEITLGLDSWPDDLLVVSCWVNDESLTLDKPVITFSIDASLDKVVLLFDLIVSFVKLAKVFVDWLVVSDWLLETRSVWDSSD